jgi:hypothetical protein
MSRYLSRIISPKPLASVESFLMQDEPEGSARRSPGLLLVPDHHHAHRLAVRISPFRRDRRDLPILGNYLQVKPSLLKPMPRKRTKPAKKQR